MVAAQCVMDTLQGRLDRGHGWRHVPHAEGESLDDRLRLGDLPAIGDAMAEAADELRVLSQRYYHAIGDGGVSARIAELKAMHDARRCKRD